MQRPLAALICTIAFASFAHAQYCLPEGIIITSQAQVNSFAASYPGCTIIEGYMRIGPGSANNLAGLAQLTAVSGYLQIGANPQLTSLDGLDNLTSVGGLLGITGNAQLTHIAALANLTTVGGTLEISVNDNLTSLNGLQGLTAVGGMLEIRDSPGLTDLQGLEGLVSIGEDILINNNPALATMQGLSPTSVGGAFSLMNNPQLMDLSAASQLTSLGGVLSLVGNTSILNLGELSGITAINGLLRVMGSSGLMSLDGLANIEAHTIQNLIIANNPGLFQCAVESICDYLAIPASMANITGNATGCADRPEVEEACTLLSVLHMAHGIDAISVFPNPGNGFFHVRIEHFGEVHFTVFDMMGRAVYQRTMSANGAMEIPIHLSDLAPGAYLLQLRTDDTVSSTRIIME